MLFNEEKQCNKRALHSSFSDKRHLKNNLLPKDAIVSTSQ